MKQVIQRGLRSKSTHAPDGLRTLVCELREVDVEHLGQPQQLCVISSTVAPCQPGLQQRIWYAGAMHRDVEAKSGAFDEGLSQQAAVVDAVDDAARVVQLDARAVAVSAAGPALETTSRESQAVVEAAAAQPTVLMSHAVQPCSRIFCASISAYLQQQRRLIHKSGLEVMGRELTWRDATP